MDFHEDMRNKILTYVDKGQIYVDYAGNAAVITRYGCVYPATDHEMVAFKKLVARDVISGHGDTLEHEGKPYQKVLLSK